MALEMLYRASEVEPSNPQAKFHRANVLIQMGRSEDALEPLESVRDFVPRDAAVRFKMGKVCKRLGRTDEAMMHFTTALDLDPKDSNRIKAAIDKLNDPSDDVDDGL